MNRILSAVCGGLCAIALFAIMVLTFLDVGSRKLLDNSIPGSLELTELLMVVVIFAALPLVSLRDEHVTFDSLDGMLSPAMRRVQHTLVHLICAAMMLGLCWLMWRTGLKFLDNGETTAQLRILKAPFIFAMSVFLGVAGVLHVGMLFAGPPSRGAESTEGVAL